MANPMTYRSTNADGRYVHFGGAFVAGVEYYNGVEINPSSTNTAPSILPAGDDANISIRIAGKGTGGVLLGSTGTGSVGIRGAFTATSTASWAAITGGHGTEFQIASTTADINPGDLVSVELTIDTANLSSQTGIASVRTSTGASSRVVITLNNFGSTAGSTGSGTFRITWLDLT